MKLVALTSAALLAATTAFAGNMNFEAPAEDAVIVETTPPAATGSAGSTGWLLPVGAVVLLALALSESGHHND